jgi:hypothetical protein
VERITRRVYEDANAAVDPGAVSRLAAVSLSADKQPVLLGGEDAALVEAELTRDPGGRLTCRELVASVGAYFSYFGVPAYGSAKPVARMAGCATP